MHVFGPRDYVYRWQKLPKRLFFFCWFLLLSHLSRVLRFRYGYLTETRFVSQLVKSCGSIYRSHCGGFYKAEILGFAGIEST